MEAAQTQRSLTGEKATRIVDAMRVSVAERGVARSTFDHVAKEAGVSRGLLHYYFGTKERLLVEVVRRDCDVRLELLDDQLSGARTADDLVAQLVASLEDLVANDPAFLTLVFELFTLSRCNAEIAASFSELLSRQRDQVADLLRSKEAEGVMRLAAPADAVVDVLFGLADGLALRMLSEPGREYADTIRAGVMSVRALLDAPG